MLKQEYAQHIAEMSQRVRCEEWAELEKNKEDFFETGNTWALSWLGHLTVMDAAMYHYTWVRRKQDWKCRQETVKNQNMSTILFIRVQPEDSEAHCLTVLSKIPK